MRHFILSLQYTIRPISAYPDGHPDDDVDEDSEIDHLRAKIDAGADFVITQLFYDVDRFVQWSRKVRNRGNFAFSLPIARY